MRASRSYLLLAGLLAALVSGCGDGPILSVAVVNETAGVIHVRVAGLGFWDFEADPDTLTFVVPPKGSMVVPDVRPDMAEDGSDWQGTIWVYGPACDRLGTFVTSNGSFLVTVDAEGPRLDSRGQQDAALAKAEVSTTDCR